MTSFFTTILISDVKKSFLLDWSLTKHFSSSWRPGHLGQGLSKAPLSRGLRCLCSEARAAACSRSSPYCLRWGQGQARGAGFCSELRVREDEDPERGREMSTRATPGVAKARPRGVRGCSGTSGCGGGPGCGSPSCGCYWQPSLCLARSPAAPGRKVAKGNPLRRRRHAGSAAQKALLAPARALRSLRALTAAVRHGGQKGSSAGGVAASEASNDWRPL